MEKKSFALGYSMVVHSVLMYLISTWVVAMSANYIIPAIAEKLAVETVGLYAINTYGALISVVVAFFMAQLLMKVSVRIVTVISLFIAAIAALISGFASNVPVYAIGMCLLFCTAQGYGFTVTNTLIANWFPRRKAEMLGFATAGVFLGNLTITPIFNKIVGSSGIEMAMVFIAIVLFVMSVASLFWLRNRPEDVGLFPDNDAKSVEHLAAMKEAAKNYKTAWPISRLLKTPVVWFLIVGFGFMLLMSSGMGAQAVPLLTSRGLTRDVAVKIIMVNSCFGFIGSIVTGFLDKKFGPRKTTLIMTCVFVVGFIGLAVFLDYRITVAFMFITNFFVGGCMNMMPSLAITIFGAKEFASVNRLIHPCTQIIKALSFITIGLSSMIAPGAVGTMGAFAICTAICGLCVLPITPKLLLKNIEK